MDKSYLIINQTKEPPSAAVLKMVADAGVELALATAIAALLKSGIFPAIPLGKP